MHGKSNRQAQKKKKKKKKTLKQIQKKSLKRYAQDSS